MTAEAASKRRVTMSEVKETSKQIMSDLGDGIEKLTSDIKQAFKGRNHTLMVRVDQETLDRIDELVETEIFTSRSEASAFLLNQGIKKQENLFNKLEASTTQIKSLRESMKGIVASELTGNGDIKPESK